MLPSRRRRNADDRAYKSVPTSFRWRRADAQPTVVLPSAPDVGPTSARLRNGGRPDTLAAGHNRTRNDVGRRSRADGDVLIGSTAARWRSAHWVWASINHTHAPETRTPKTCRVLISSRENDRDFTETASEWRSFRWRVLLLYVRYCVTLR